MRLVNYIRRDICLTAVLRAVCLLFTAIACNPSVHAQTAPSPSSDLRLTQFLHTDWTVEQGLPQNSVYDVVQASDGYLWIGTQDGLVRFDGIRFEVFDKSDGLGANEVRALLPSDDGSLWIGTNGGGLSRLRDGRITTYTTADGLPSDLVRVLYRDSRGALWIGTIEGGLVKFDGSTFTTYSTAEGLAGDVVLSIEESAEGDLWIGTQAGLSRFRDGAFTSYTSAQGLPGSLVWALQADKSGSVWIGTSGGLARVKDGTIQQYASGNSECDDVVEALHEDASGALWIGTFKNGVCRYQHGAFDNFNSEDGLRGSRVRSITSDQEGNLWVGTESGGLNRLRQGKFAHVAVSEGLSDNMAFTVIEDAAGHLWVGTKNNGLNRISGDEVTTYTTENGLPSDHIYALTRSAGGGVWVGMYAGGLCRLNESGRRCLDAGDGLRSDNVYAVHEDRGGTVWIGTDAGLSLLKHGEVSSYSGDPELESTPITAIYEDGAGDIWIGLYGGGLRRLHGNKVDRFAKETGFVDAKVLVLHEDSSGGIWAGTQGAGLCRLQNGKSACLTVASGLPSDNVLQILEDDGRLWLGTMQGIVSVSMDEAVDVLEGRAQRVSPATYGKADGLKATELNGGTQPAAWKSADGRLWFATNHGVAVIQPRNIRLNSVPPPVVVERIDVNGTPQPITASIILPAGTRDLTFHYTGLSFTAPEKVRFQYKLDGYDGQWIDAGTRREAYYTNLPPGDYTFQVRAANSDGVWSETSASVAFYLKPFFYQTWWFKLMGLAAALMAAFGAYRIRIRQLKARERELERVVDERTRDLRREKEKTEEAKRVIEGQAEKLRELDRFKTSFFANVSHEFRTPLTMIIGPLENLLSSAREQLSDGTRTQVEMMLRNALRLMRLINQLLDLSKLEDAKMELKARVRNVVPFIEGIVSSCWALTERKGIELTFEKDSEEILLCYEPDKLEKVFFNLLSNAAKFTPTGGTISVSIKQMPSTEAMPAGFAELHFRDTGKGIPEDQLPWIFDRFHQVDGSNTREHEGTGIGLALAKELVLLHHGTIEVESEVGKGTMFTVRLPMGQAHLQPDQIAATDEETFVEDSAMTELATAAFDTIHESIDSPVISTPPDESAPLILVVDDNMDVREYIAGILSETYRVVMAQNGEEGLQRAQELVPDLILTDVMMPKMDGNEFCRSVKNDPKLDHIPVILLTARATHQLKIEALEMGADDYVPKPFNAHELQVRIKNLLHLRHQEKELKGLNENLEEKVRKQFEQLVEERRRYEDELIESKERAEASDRLKSTILNNLSHEFRTPLTAIMGYSQIIDSEGPETLREFTAEIDRGSKRLLRTLDSLLRLSRIESDSLGQKRGLFELTQSVAGVVDRYAQSVRSKGLKLDFSSTHDGDLFIDVDRAAVEEVVMNLLDNAVKFTSEGSVAVEIGQKDDDVFIRIVDTGIGMSSDFLPHAFEAFVQESDGLARVYEGCGLGLTIARRLVELMNGKIMVETEAGVGSTFTVTLPVRMPTMA